MNEGVCRSDGISKATWDERVPNDCFRPTRDSVRAGFSCERSNAMTAGQ